MRRILMKKKVNSQTSFKVDMGKRLKKIRQKHEYSQDNMAEILEITSAYYGKVERGEHSLSVEKMVLLHKKLNIDMNYLILGKTAQSTSFSEILAHYPDEHKNDIKMIMKHLLNLVSEGERP